LEDLGFRTTKSVWPIAGRDEPTLGGATCDDDDYRDWLLRLQRAGFEIGFHNATYHTSTREQTIRGIERFEEIFGHEPKTHANHASNSEGIYWGNARVTGLHSGLYAVLTRFRRWGQFRGHRKGDPLFWGDVCRQRIKYVRNFVFADINTLAACPYMPYRDPSRPWVQCWFASTEGGTLESFTRTIAEENQDRLERQGGACIMYTHFAKDFFQHGRLHDAFRRRMERLAAKDGWFVPVGTLLDYIVEKRGPVELTSAQRAGLERKWLIHKLLVGTT
jgi:hypothetical protein